MYPSTHPVSWQGTARPGRKGQQQVGQREPYTQGREDAQCEYRRLRERGADGESHERRSAGRRDQSGQHAREKRGAIAIALGEAVADARKSGADFEKLRTS